MIIVQHILENLGSTYISNEQRVRWIQTHFDAPESKSWLEWGKVWFGWIRRCWSIFDVVFIAFKKPTQVEYHKPRSFLKPKKSLLAIFEEELNVKPKLIDFVIINIDTVFSYIGENYPPSVRHWTKKKWQNPSLHWWCFLTAFLKKKKKFFLTADLKCSGTKKTATVEFASFRNPNGTCWNFTLGSCNAPASKQVIEKVTFESSFSFFYN